MIGAQERESCRMDSEIIFLILSESTKKESGGICFAWKGTDLTVRGERQIKKKNAEYSREVK